MDVRGAKDKPRVGQAPWAHGYVPRPFRDEREEQGYSGFFVVMAMVVAAGLGYWARGWVAETKSYSTYSECILVEMKGRQQALLPTVRRYCDEKRTSGQIK